ncbi:MAG: serine O-acetyltransferase [Synergistaceae bacterium]|jgi:serine O-acetyltransferase|nr:serine O-acetyltransferase [Synergistaceae bacterium]
MSAQIIVRKVVSNVRTSALSGGVFDDASNGGDLSIRGLTDAILESYREEESIIKIEAKNRLGDAAVGELIEKLRELIFAGFFSKKSLKSDSIEYYVGELLEALSYQLRKQIACALQSIGREDDAVKEAGDVTGAFLSRIPDVRRLLATDVAAFYDGDPAARSPEEIILSYPGIYAIMVSRLAHELHMLGVPLLPRMMTEYAHSRTGIDIHPGATIGHHFFIDHGTGIVVGETTVIGNYVKIYQGVTLGALSTRDVQTLRGVKRHPTVEDHVTIYSGASIFGGDTIIGEGVVIGSNAFITKSVPGNTRVSVKNPELQFRESLPMCNVEFSQDEFWDYVI